MLEGQHSEGETTDHIINNGRAIVHIPVATARGIKSGRSESIIQISREAVRTRRVVAQVAVVLDGRDPDAAVGHVQNDPFALRAAGVVRMPDAAVPDREGPLLALDRDGPFECLARFARRVRAGAVASRDDEPPGN